jgi:hypothetical protein
MKNTPKTNIEKTFVGTDHLGRLAIYLEGIVAGKGNLHPLGTVTIEELWNAIRYLDGDIRYTAKRDEQ